MSSTLSSVRRRRSREIPPLHNGDRLTQAGFHRRYEACPEDARFELIEGIVVMASPVGLAHSQYHGSLVQAAGWFETSTAGVALSVEGTVILDDESEIQPETSLFILPEFGGQTTRSRNGLYLRGAPEWIGEIAHSSVAIDLHRKKDACQHAGVHEF